MNPKNDNEDKSNRSLEEELLTPESIRAFRESKGMSQQQLADLLGVGVATVSRWESTGDRSKKPSGTGALVLKTLIAKQKGLIDPTKKELWVGPLASIALGVGAIGAGFALYRVLKSVFEEEPPKGGKGK